jgi:hypothetical protein
VSADLTFTPRGRLLNWLDLYRPRRGYGRDTLPRHLCCKRVHMGDPIDGAHYPECYKVQREDDPLAKCLMVFTGFTIPDPLTRCTRCGEHAAFYKGSGSDEGYYCGPCGSKVSIFRLPMADDDLRQLAADAELERIER